MTLSLQGDVNPSCVTSLNLCFVFLHIMGLMPGLLEETGHIHQEVSGTCRPWPLLPLTHPDRGLHGLCGLHFPWLRVCRADQPPFSVRIHRALFLGSGRSPQQDCRTWWGVITPGPHLIATGAFSLRALHTAEGRGACCLLEKPLAGPQAVAIGSLPMVDLIVYYFPLLALRSP